MIMSGAEPFFLPGGRTGVLLIHGFTGLPAELLLMGKYLQAQGYTVLGVRLAGHGTTAEDMSHMTGEDWLDSVRDGYALLRGCCDRVVAGGHSMGGLLALLLAAEQEVMGVISMSAPIYMLKSAALRSCRRAGCVQASLCRKRDAACMTFLQQSIIPTAPCRSRAFMSCWVSWSEPRPSCQRSACLH